MNPSVRTLAALILAMALAVILVPAGGLGLAPLAGIFVFLSLPLKPVRDAVRQPGAALALSALAIAWFCLTFIWSGYDQLDELWKLALLTPLFMMVPLAAGQIAPHHLHLARAALVFAVFAIFLVLGAESLTRGDMTLSYKLSVENFSVERNDLQIAVERGLSRGATPALMMGGIVAIMLWHTSNRILRGLAAGLAVIAVIIATDYNVYANAVAFVAAAGVCALAARWPRQVAAGLFHAIAVILIFTPLIFTALLALPDAQLRPLMPMSWEWRLEIWQYALGRIGEQPVFGHGLGAARVIDATNELRGFQIDLLPLHAHNAGMTIWLETGATGALLAGGALIAIGRAVARMTLSRPAALMVCWAVTIWFVNVTLSYGVWQEWHHAALAFAIAMTILARPAPVPAGNLLHPR
ncbi:MAG: O-antigen ligase family protein [Glycocaulis sp.]